MKPNFALSLSFEGIELLHRMRHGWKRLGTADVEDKNLDKALADLRDKAERLAPDGVHTKLIIPLDQIKYIAIDSTQTTEDDILATLEGATPYRLDELVIDRERFGGRTHIAAVARETLQEAEAFAHAHGFNPVSFVAVPEPFTFQKEVFFGPTSMMQDILGFGAEVEADPIPVMVVGTRIKSRLLVFDLPEDAIPPSDDFDLAAALAPHVEKEAPSEDLASLPPVQDFDLAAALAPHVAEELPQEEVAEGPENDVDEPDPVDPLITDAPEQVVAEDEPEPVADAVAADDVLAEDIVEPTADVDPATDAVEEEIVAADVSEPDMADEEQDAEVLVEVTQDAEPEPVTADEQTSPADVPAEPVLVSVDAPVAAPAPQIFDRVIAEYYPPVIEQAVEEPVRLIPQTPVFAALPLFDRVIPEVIPGQKRPVAKPLILTARAPLVAAATPKLGAADPLVSRQGAIANENRRPLWVAGLIAASLAMIGIVAWSQYDDFTRETGALVEEVAIIDVDTVAEATEEVTEAEVVAEDAAAEIAAAPSLPAPSLEIISVAPQTPELEIATLVAPAETVVFAPSALTWPLTADDLVIRDLPDLIAEPAAADVLPAPVQLPPAPPAEEEALAEVGAPVLRGRVLSPADATRIYEATGVWQRAPRFVDVPGTTSTNGLIIPFSETVPGRLVQPAMPEDDGYETDLSFLSPADPPPADVTFPRDEDGFILATPEGTVTPEGAVVFAGTPEITGELRPTLSEADLARMALLAPAPKGVVIIAGAPPTVPPLRPADAALPEPEPAPEEEFTAALPEELAGEAPAAAGGVALSNIRPDGTGALVVITDPEDLDTRPQPRPSALASTAVPADPGTPDITSIIAQIEAETPEIEGATDQAVVASLRPEGRPANFATVVAAARARQAAPAPQAAPVQTAAPVAPQNFAPVPGGVARAATQEGVIRLREINLIGVYGRPNSRRALVRLSNGRYVRVEVGSALDGGQVTAIGETALNYVKRGRTIALQLPSG